MKERRKKPRPRVPSWFTKRAYSKWIGIDVSECLPLCSMDAKSFMNSTIRIHARRIAYDSIAATAVAVDIIYYLNPKTKVVHFTYVRLEACAVEQCRWNRQKEKTTQSITEWVFSCHSNLRNVWNLNCIFQSFYNMSDSVLSTKNVSQLTKAAHHVWSSTVGVISIPLPPQNYSFGDRYVRQSARTHSTIYVAIEWDQ